MVKCSGIFLLVLIFSCFLIHLSNRLCIRKGILEAPFFLIAMNLYMHTRPIFKIIIIIISFGNLAIFASVIINKLRVSLLDSKTLQILVEHVWIFFSLIS